MSEYGYIKPSKISAEWKLCLCFCLKLHDLKYYYDIKILTQSDQYTSDYTFNYYVQRQPAISTFLRLICREQGAPIAQHEETVHQDQRPVECGNQLLHGSKRENSTTQHTYSMTSQTVYWKKEERHEVRYRNKTWITKIIFKRLDMTFSASTSAIRCQFLIAYKPVSVTAKQFWIDLQQY